MTFRVGQKVVCVDDRGRRGHWEHVKSGDIYIVRGFTTHPDEGFSGIVVEGIERVWRGVDCPFLAYRFRPIVERKTSIEIFTKMLTGKRVDA